MFPFKLISQLIGLSYVLKYEVEMIHHVFFDGFFIDYFWALRFQNIYVI